MFKIKDHYMVLCPRYAHIWNYGIKVRSDPIFITSNDFTSQFVHPVPITLVPVGLEVYLQRRNDFPQRHSTPS
jgi:hypothetical protein